MRLSLVSTADRFGSFLLKGLGRPICICSQKRGPFTSFGSISVSKSLSNPNISISLPSAAPFSFSLYLPLLDPVVRWAFLSASPSASLVVQRRHLPDRAVGSMRHGGGNDARWSRHGMSLPQPRSTKKRCFGDVTSSTKRQAVCDMEVVVMLNGVGVG
jgi:hypothetical protein